ncbi:LysR family transcriptional regulator [Microbacterium xylanilyticum]
MPSGTGGHDALRPRLDDISVRHLRYALAVCEAGSVSAAADDLRVAQPSLSQQLRKLEGRLGVQLFERTPSGLIPTADGGDFLARAAVFLVNLTDAVEALTHTGGPLKVGIPSGIRVELVGKVEGLIRNGYGAERVELVTGSSADVAALLACGRLTFGLIREPCSHSALVTAVVSEDPLGVVVGRDHPLAGRRSATWTAVRDMRLLWFAMDRAPEFAESVLAHIAARGWVPELVAGPTSHALFQHRLLTESSIVALRPQSAVDAEPLLRWLPFEDGPPVERVALAALAGTRAAEFLTQLAL